MPLNKAEIKKLIEEKDLIENYIHFETQINPNGFDFTVKDIESFEGRGKLDFSNDEREIPRTEPLKPKKQDPGDKYGWWKLEKGVYKVKTNEIVNIPKNLVGIAFPRSSLLRMGCFIQNGIWDGGFSGRSEFLLYVGRRGVEIKENARIDQVMFFHMDEVEEGYRGKYQDLK